ncbi:MAG TPA: hypothetical protein VMU43_11985 [Candidatus Acidoferrum sp.]|nr:hypothetical protein [Candidatus Acidoferrum sp.]
MMTPAKPKAFLAGAGLVWRRQRVLWLIYFFTLLLAFLSTRGLVHRAADVLDHSAESAQRLVHGFDISAIIELQQIPQSPLTGSNDIFGVAPVITLLFLLFITGGILTVYYRDETLPFGPFFDACGDHFWRFLRLLIYFAIVMIPVLILIGVTSAAYHHIDEVSVSPLTAVRFALVAGTILLLISMALRLWFDMAQVIAVAEEERAMHRALRQAAVLFARNFFSLFWLYLRTSIVAVAGFALGLYIWMMVLRPESIHKAFVLGQLLILWWIATRLWQRASEAKWYWEYRGSQPSAAPAWTPPPAPAVPPPPAPAPSVPA